MSRLLVTGATGTVGSALVAELRGRDVAVRAFVRDAGRAAAALGGDLEPAVGDLADPISVRRALEGVDAVFLACGNVPGLPRAVLGRARPGGGPPVALRGPRRRPATRVLPDEPAGRRRARRRGGPAAGVGGRRADRDGRPARRRGGGGRRPHQDGHEGRTYVLTGPEAVTHHEVAAALSQAAGRPVEYVDVPGEVAREGMLAAGLPPFVADGLAGLYAALRAGGHAAPTGTVQAVTGAGPRDLATWTREHARAFGASALV